MDDGSAWRSGLQAATLTLAVQGLVAKTRARKNVMILKTTLLLVGGLAAVTVVALAGSLAANGAALFEPPGWRARLSTYLTRNVAHTRPAHPFPELRTPVFDAPVHVVSQAVRESLAELGWQVTDAGADDARWQVVVRTPLLRFRDDMSITLAGAGDGRTAMEVRSRSRIGRGDLGANRAHVLALVRTVAHRLERKRQR